MLGSAAISSMVSGIVSGKKNRAFSTLLVAAVLMVIGTSCLSTLSNGLKVEAKAYGFQIFVGCGFGLTVSTASMIAAVESEIRDHGSFSPLALNCRKSFAFLGMLCCAVLNIGSSRRPRYRRPSTHTRR